MLFVTPTGECIEVAAAREGDFRDEVIRRMADSGVPHAAIAVAVDRSREYVVRRLRLLRGRPAARAAVELVIEGDGPWTPHVERPGRVDCPRCRRADPGTGFVCLACMRSSRDPELEAELARERAAEDERRRRHVLG